ncbi:MAG TPA: YceI family protein [Chitinophagaceae bacterium]|nr:YceI family protein [Chitinophagaceae bacterium]
MKKVLFTAVVACIALQGSAQKFMTRSGKISFFSTTPIENIEAFNNEVAAAVNTASGDVVFQVPIKSFKFEKQLMQEHFNESYMESDKFPKAEFKGKMNPAAFTKDGTYKTTVNGKLTIHGVTKDVQIPGTVIVKGGELTLNTKFNVAIADYNIQIPSVAKGKVANQIEVTVNSVLKKA